MACRVGAGLFRLPIRLCWKGGGLMDIMDSLMFLAELVVLHPEVIHAACLLIACVKQRAGLK